MADTRRVTRFILRLRLAVRSHLGTDVATAALLALLWMGIAGPAIYRAGALSAQQPPPPPTPKPFPSDPPSSAPGAVQTGEALGEARTVVNVGAFHAFSPTTTGKLESITSE